MNWAKQHVTSTLYVCWAAQAGLKLLYDLPKRTRKEKLSGVYHHEIHHPFHPILRGFDDTFLAPHSRYADFSPQYLEEHTDLDILATSDVAGVYLAATKDKRNVFVTGHPEYDALTLHNEYTVTSVKVWSLRFQLTTIRITAQTTSQMQAGVATVICSSPTGSIIVYINKHRMILTNLVKQTSQKTINKKGMPLGIPFQSQKEKLTILFLCIHTHQQAHTHRQ